MVAPEPLVICSKTLQNTLFSVQHPQNRVWGPTCDHSVPRECGSDHYSICKSNDGVCANTDVLSLPLHPPVHILE